MECLYNIAIFVKHNSINSFSNKKLISMKLTTFIKQNLLVMSTNSFQIGSKVMISPELTGEEQWIEGIVDDLDNNPFNGLVVYAKAIKNQIIYFNRQEYFKLA